VRWWKAVGLAGIVGVAAGGVVVARGERQRRSYSPEEIRTRLRARLSEAATAQSSVDLDASPPRRPDWAPDIAAPSPRRRWPAIRPRRWRRRRPIHWSQRHALRSAD